MPVATIVTVDAHIQGYNDRDDVRLTRLRDGRDQGNADMMNGAMARTEARTMLARWCYLCYNDEGKGDG